MSCPRSFRIISISPIWVASSAFLRVFRVRCRGHAKVLQTLLSVFKETKLCFHKFPLFQFFSFYFGFFPLAFPPCFRLYQPFLFFSFSMFHFSKLYGVFFTDPPFSSKLLLSSCFFRFFFSLCYAFFSFSSFSLKLQSDWTRYLHRLLVIQKNINK